MQLPVVICNVKENGVIYSGTRFLSTELPNLLMDSVLIQYCFFTYLTLVELLVLVKIFSPTVTTF